MPMKLRIERSGEKKHGCCFWAGQYTGPGLALFCKDKNGVCAHEISLLSKVKVFEPNTFQSAEVPVSIENKWVLAIVREPGASPSLISAFDTEKEAARAQKRAIKAIRSMRVPSRAWIYWLIAVIFTIGVMAVSVFSVGIPGKGAAETAGKSQAANAASQQMTAPASPFGPQLQVAPAEPPAKIDITQLPPDNHAWGFGNPKGKPVYVFSDPTCHYCGELDRALKTLGKDYYVHLFPTPVRGKDGVALVANFACSSNPQAAWDNWMENGKFDEKVEIKPECSSPALAVANSNIGIMKALGFKGVPVIIRADGAAINGSMASDELAAWLSQSTK